MNIDTPHPVPHVRLAVTASTSGSVLAACLADPFFRGLVGLVVCDRACGAVGVGRNAGISTEIRESESAEEFADHLARDLPRHGIDFILSFSTRFYPEWFRRKWADRIVNFHPSLLPAFPGNDAWEYVRHYGVCLAGSTVEFIHERMDAGKIIQQTCLAWDPRLPDAVMRHRLFVQQCRSVLQVTRWLAAVRIRTDGHRVVVDGARYDDAACCPALEDPEVIAFEPPAPAPHAPSGPPDRS